jgi:regulator of sigma E protease
MDTEQMQQPAQPWEFRSKPAWQRLIIMLGGVTVNLILGFLIYMMILFVWGKNTLYSEALPLGLDPSPIAEEIGFQAGDQLITVDGKALDNVLEINKFLFLRSVESVTVKHTDGRTEQMAIPDDFGKRMFESGELIPFSPVTMAVLDSVIPNSPAATAGLLPNDKILSIDGIQVQNWSDFKDEMTDESRTINLVYERNRSQDTLQLTTDIDGTLGVFPQFPGAAFTNEKLSLTESISEGFSYGYWTLHDYVAQFQYIFTQKGASQLGGFGAIGNMFPSTWNWKGFWASTALISIILAFMNILPIPALDGGHVMFLAYEIITGRKPNDKFMEYAQMFGFFLLLALVLYANGNDLYRLIFS